MSFWFLICIEIIFVIFVKKIKKPFQKELVINFSLLKHFVLLNPLNTKLHLSSLFIPMSSTSPQKRI